jgi:hypothetical protein
MIRACIQRVGTTVPVRGLVLLAERARKRNGYRGRAGLGCRDGMGRTDVEVNEAGEHQVGHFSFLFPHSDDWSNRSLAGQLLVPALAPCRAAAPTSGPTLSGFATYFSA